MEQMLWPAPACVCVSLSRHKWRVLTHFLIGWKGQIRPSLTRVLQQDSGHLSNLPAEWQQRRHTHVPMQGSGQQCQLFCISQIRWLLDRRIYWLGPWKKDFQGKIIAQTDSVITQDKWRLGLMDKSQIHQIYGYLHSTTSLHNVQGYFQFMSGCKCICISKQLSFTSQSRGIRSHSSFSAC